MKHGQYVNPGNSGFQVIINSEYIDKTGLIGQMNSRIDSPEGMVCVSRPRRFGKSYAAKMLCAYYDISCDSRELFDGRAISKMDGYEEHRNKYNVICFDVTSFFSEIVQRRGSISDIVCMIPDAIQKDLIALYPYLASESTLTDCLLRCVEKEEKKFIFIIDEWDAVIREADPAVQKAYLNLLRGWFKNISFTPKVVAAAYLTGILPIKKDGSQSAISDFIEYPILYPDGFAQYSGFMASEVHKLCLEHQLDFKEFETWYDGYDFPGCGPIYNPYSVMRAIRAGKCRSYWQRTSAAESLFTYINMDYEGLQELIARLIAGEEIEVDVDGFENDFESFKNKDDILTLLIHLGYLTYQEDERTVRIPNEEIRNEFHKILRKCRQRESRPGSGPGGQEGINMNHFVEIANHFQLDTRAVSAEGYGGGHINDTFLLTTESGRNYILQRINTSVFKNPDALMNNVILITDFLKKKIAAAGGDPERETLSVILTDEEKPLYWDGGECWRVYTFIKGAVTLQSCETGEQFQASASAFGHFQKLLADFPADTLYESIPNFHNTKSRFLDFEEAVARDVCGRAASVAREIAFVRSRREFASVLVDMQERGELPLRVTHNDTKLDNVLFDRESGQPLAVVDLDTVMPGLSINDFGDSIRFGATHAAEDEPDLSKVNFELGLFECYTRGFLGECGLLMTENEKKMLPVGAMMMTFECGMRFLTDYLNGDTYFKIHRQGHNLDRCRTQFKLVSDMEKAKAEMDRIVRKYC